MYIVMHAYTLCHDGLKGEAGYIVCDSIAVSVADRGVLTTVGVGTTQTDMERPVSWATIHCVPDTIYCE